ncbi:MAG: RNA-directed DNA polymerase [Saprospiraceae bacterium]|nr:RNA-directed DNA polymerase [Saprospiraceae bacterium]
MKFAQVMSIFKDILNKKIELEVLKSLSEITTYKGRLPMGSPTSPVISNFAMLNTDFELLNWCMAEKIEYTRYADDLSFSSDTPFSNETFIRIKDVLHHYGFEINPSKVKFYNKSDQKIVTGIVVGDTGLGLQEDYFTKLEKGD